MLWAALIFGLSYLYVNGRLIRFSDQAGHRSLHQGSVLTGGGFLIFLPLSLVMFSSGWYLPAAMLMVLTVVGLLDDIYALSAALRLFVQLAVVLLTLGYMGFDSSLWGLFMAVSFLWWLNLFNFMDGANGLVAMHAIVTLGLPLIMYDMPIALNPVVVFSLVALFIYLYFNVGLKCLFMGDSGSLPLAYLIGLLMLVMMNVGSFNLIQVLLMHAVLIIDSSLTLLNRLFRGEPIMQAHRSHLYQRLISQITHHWPVSLAYAALTAVCCIIAYMIGDYSLTSQLLWFFGVNTFLMLVFFHCRRIGR